MNCRICGREEDRRGPRHRYCRACSERIDEEKTRLRRAKYELKRGGRRKKFVEVEAVSATVELTTEKLTFKDRFGREFVVIWSGSVRSATGVKGGLLPAWPSKDRGFTP